MIKAILFDVDNTLLSFDEYVKDSMKCGFKEFGLPEYEDEMFHVFTQINNGLWQEIQRGKLDFNGLIKIRWNKIFEALGISADGVAFEEYFQEFLFNSAIVEDGAMEILEYLKDKYILCVASNGPYEQQVNRLKVCGMLPYFTDVFISEDIGSSKPSGEFFHACVSRLNSKVKQDIRPCEILVIGDSLSSDIEGGNNMGMQTCYYNPHNRQVPTGIKVDYNITSLKKIKEFL